MAEEQKGTGKHPHKSTEEPWPHHEQSRSDERMESRGNRNENEGRSQSSGNSNSQGGPSSSTEDLKSREYRDEKGEIHHHTHTAEAMKDRKAS